MSDKEARALGAAETYTIKDKEYKLSPVPLRDLAELQRESVSYYKRQYLKTFADNLDLIGGGVELLEKKMQEVAGWDIGKIPKQVAYDVSTITITDRLKVELEQRFGSIPKKDNGIRALVAAALDAMSITKEDVKAWTGTGPQQGFIPYDLWWITATFDGMASFVYRSLRIKHPEITRDILQDWSFMQLTEVARLAENITAPSLGNT